MNFGKEVLQANSSIKRVTLGAGGRTPYGLFETTTLIQENIAHGSFYGDAEEQYLVTSKRSLSNEQELALIDLCGGKDTKLYDCMQYLLAHQMDTSNFVERCNKLKSDFPNLPKLFNVYALKQLLEYTDKPSFDDLELIDFETVAPNGNELTIGGVMWQAISPEQVIKVLPRIPSQDRLLAIQHEIKYYPIVFYAAEQPEMLKSVLKGLTQEQISVLLTHGGDNTILHHAASARESLELLLPYYSPDQFLDALKVKSFNKKTIWHFAASDPESLEILLAPFSKDEQHTAFMAKDEKKQTVWHYAAQNTASLKYLLSLFLPEQLEAALMSSTPYDGTVWHYATRNPASLKCLLSYFSEDQRLAMLTNKKWGGNSAFHYGVKKPEVLKLFLMHLPGNELLTALMTKDNMENTALHDAVKNPKSLQIFLNYLKEGHSAKTALHYAAQEPEILKLFLIHLPANERLTVLMTKDNSEKTALHYAAGVPESLKYLLSCSSREERQTMLMAQDGHGKTVFDYAISNGTLTLDLNKYLLEHNNDRPFFYAAKNSESLQILLNMMNGYQQAYIQGKLRERDNESKTVLHYAASNSQAFSLLLSKISPNQRIEMLITKDKDGKSALHYATDFPDSLNVVLTLTCYSNAIKMVLELLIPLSHEHVLSPTRNQQINDIVEAVADIKTIMSHTKKSDSILIDNLVSAHIHNQNVAYAKNAFETAILPNLTKNKPQVVCYIKKLMLFLEKKKNLSTPKSTLSTEQKQNLDLLVFMIICMSFCVLTIKFTICIQALFIGTRTDQVIVQDVKNDPSNEVGFIKRYFF